MESWPDGAALFETEFAGPAVLVMGSGTGEGGPAAFWQTPGGLERLSVADVASDIGMLTGYSAHADQAGLIEWAFSHWNGVTHQIGRTVFLQHGADDQRATLANALRTAAERNGTSMHVICPGGEPGRASKEGKPSLE